MKDYAGKVTYKGIDYDIVFNLNVMEAIQEKYGTLEKWGALTDGTESEPNVKAIIFGIREMLNEGIDIHNEEEGSKIKPLTLKQVGRLISEIGVDEVTNKMNNTVVKSTESAEKNA